MSWEQNVRCVEPYVPGEQPKVSNMIKLNTNECPYPPAPKVQEVLSQTDAERMRLYPDPKITDLTEALAHYHQVDPAQVFVGIGSDDVLSVAFLTFFHSGKPVLFPDITYSFYPVWADVYGIPYATVPVDEAFQIHPEDYKRENGGIVIANPNAPTTLELSTEGIREILNANSDSVVIVDEAYVDFGGTTALSLVSEYDNLLVVRTFSKSRSMAGMRIGYAIGSAKLIKYMSDVKFSINSYTLNRISITTGTASVQDDAYFKEIVARVMKTRDTYVTELRKLGFVLPDSKTNFYFATHPKYSAEFLMTKLRERNIFVRHFKKPECISNYLRISIGTDEEMEALVKALKEIMEG